MGGGGVDFMNGCIFSQQGIVNMWVSHRSRFIGYS